MRATTIALVALALTTTACGDGLPEIDSSAARVALDATTAGDEPTACPVAASETLIDQAFALVDDDASRNALEQGEASVLIRTIGASDVLVCGRSADDSLTVGLAIGPGDETIEGHIARLSEPGVTAEVDVTERREHRGGRVARLCLRRGNAPSLDLCEVVWVDGAVFVSAFAGGPDATEVGLAPVEERFIALVQLVLDDFADN